MAIRWWAVFVVAQIWWVTGWAWGSEQVLLRDISVLTLHQGQMTTGRRSSPVPQLKCVGGSAGCRAFVPHTVQCKNVGHDGYDVQWDCKTDMDDSYRFGKIQVTCEGFEYPDDPYVLKGSCGLEYNIDYTEAGKSRKQDHGGGGYSYHNSMGQYNDESSSGQGFLFLVIVLAVVYLICKMSSGSFDDGRSHQDHQHGQRFHSGYPPSGNNPPSYGFKPEYTQANARSPPPPSYTEATDTRSHVYSSSATPNTSAGGGFWSGLGLGTLGGYLFGNRRNRGWGYGGQYNNWGGGGWGSSWGRGNQGWGSSWSGNRGYGSSWGSSQTSYRGNSRSTSSAGTSRTASGFGGTSRR